MKRIIGILCICTMVLNGLLTTAWAEEPVMVVSGQILAGSNEAVNTEAPPATGGPAVAAPSALLMEASTGQVIFEKDADTKRSPASVTKIMTMILIFDALESGKIKMTDEVVTSAHAKSMGGSQVFLEDRDIIGLNQKTF